MKMSWNYKEVLIIIIAWVLIYASDPLYSYYNHIVTDFDFSWSRIFTMWGYNTAFLVLFLANHFILVPQLVAKKRYAAYGICAAVCISLFVAFLMLKAPQFESGAIANRHALSKYHPFFLAPPDLARLVMALLLIGADLGIVAWFNEQKMKQHYLQLEKQALKQELAQLRYQINPHFFMNTLNNIHVLIDLDQERAKRAIVELSGMMRYSLYEGNENLAPLQHEIEFLKVYVSLMRLRFTNKIELYIDMPDNTPSGVMIPPLILATFVENAFKHGISHKNLSYISIKLNLEDNYINFLCENSRQSPTSLMKDEHHGIGLANVRKRLDLIYGNRYRLKIDEHDESRYFVDLQIPTSIK